MATHADSVIFGVSKRGHPTVLYKSFEYLQVRVNKNGEIYWRCKLYYNYKCNAHLKTLGDIIVSHSDVEHNHQGNISTSLARLAVGKMKKKWKKHVQHQLQM